MIVVLSGRVAIDSNHEAGEAEMVLLDPAGREARIHSDGEAQLLVLTGEPIDEPIVGYGPFVMNNEAEIRQAIEDVDSGRFGIAAA